MVKILPFLLLLISGQVFSQTCESVFLQSYRTEMENKYLKANNFNIHRGYDDYKKYFGPYFESTVASLDLANQRWLDAGAGSALTLRQIQIARTSEIQGTALVAVGFEKPKETPQALHGFVYKSGRYIEDIPNSELGKFDLITDLVGAFSYAERIDVVLKKYFELLNEDGDIYISRYGDQIQLKEGRSVDLVEWLTRIPGIKVYLPSPQSVGVHLKRAYPSKHIEIPELEIVEFETRRPPKRIYREL